MAPVRMYEPVLLNWNPALVYEMRFELPDDVKSETKLKGAMRVEPVERNVRPLSGKTFESGFEAVGTLIRFTIKYVLEATVLRDVVVTFI
jgi:hypothetical protein